MDTPAETQSASAEPRTRRPHKKSRYGCTGCRKRRIKCDEASPRCSRCEKKDLVCEYPKKRQSGLGLFSTADDASQGQQPPGSPADSLPSSSPLSPSTASPPTVDGITVITSDLVERLSASVRAQAAHSLDGRDFALFKHFLDHTSKDATVDLVDQYTLQVGIPSLALQSNFLLKSVVALSNVCRCCDIISRPNLQGSDRQTVMDLLRRAETYHMESMHEVQTTRHEATHYDHVLANAAMMGMYGSASHWIRIWLFKTAPPTYQDVLEFTPSSTQWLRLFRAVTTAYKGLRFDAPAVEEEDPQRGGQDVFQAVHDQSGQDQSWSPASREEPRVAPSRDHVLHSIIAATFRSAMSTLRENADRVLLEEGAFQMLQLREGRALDDVRTDVEASLVALEILDDIMGRNFAPDKTGAEDRSILSNNGSTSNFGMHEAPVEPLSNVSPWLQRYTSNITSTVPSKLPRRYIAAFIHKAPLRFLDMVEDILARAEDRCRSGTPMNQKQQLAFNIFAYWLVLVLLLDDVWWIRGIGGWELGRMIGLANDGGWRELKWNNRGGNWWPESMFEISKYVESYSARD